VLSQFVGALLVASSSAAGRGECDPARALARERTFLIEVEAEIERLAAERSATLLRSDIEAVRRQDREIANRQDEAPIRRDRIAVLERAVQQQEHGRLQGQYREAINVVEARLHKRAQVARDLEIALLRAAELYAAMFAERDAIVGSWPVVLPAPGDTELHLACARRKIAAALVAARKPGVMTAPAALAHHAAGIAFDVAAENRDFVDRLRKTLLTAEAM
jgi:hypothetical protein